MFSSISPAQAGANEWRTSITISSFATPSTSTSAIETPSTPLESSTTATSSSIPLASLLCYGCLLIYQGVQQSSKTKKITTTSNEESNSEIEFLPSYVGDVAKLRWDREISSRSTIGNENDDEDGEGEIESVRIMSQEEVRKGIEEFLI